MKLLLTQINLDLQTRASMNSDAVSDYRAAMENGAKFPDVEVFFDGETYWLADGFHRVHASLDADFKSIEANVRNGSRSDALKFALAANQSNGLRRTNADKRRCVEIALESFRGYSARQIADMCGVGHQLVLDAKQLDESSSSNDKVICKDGKSRPATKPKKSPAQKELAEAIKETESQFPPDDESEVKTADEEIAAEEKPVCDNEFENLMQLYTEFMGARETLAKAEATFKAAKDAMDKARSEASPEAISLLVAWKQENNYR